MKKPLNNCSWCGNDVIEKYCNHQCQAEHRKALKLNKLLLTHEGKPVKEYLIKFQLGRCNHCGIHDWNNKEVILELEHIDGNSTNNRRDNLEMICPNCHSQTPTYKAKNIGNGRHSRRKRYQEDKSY